jgi:osmotically-inducible protein OsmY
MIQSIRYFWPLGLAVLLLGWAPSAFAQGPKDTKLALKAQMALYQDAELIDVDVTSMSGFIYIRGTVPSEEASEKATQLANVKGAKEVRNRVKVGELDVASAPDDEIKAKIDEKIANDDDLKKAKLDISVTEGNVKVGGKVSDYSVAASLINDIRKVDGIKTIDFEELKY